jgi:hypothetical protein
MPEYRRELASYDISQGCDSDFGLVDCGKVSLGK